MNTITAGNITGLTGADAIHPNLTKGFYDVQINPQTGAYELHHRPAFVMPEKIYGSHNEFVTRVLKTFNALPKGMAVLLNGLKGCGKTLTAKQMAIECDMPVLTITVPLHGMGFNAFLTDLPNACLIFIDEFEKIYNEQEVRNSFLGLLDGATDNKHLFVLTSNEPTIGEYFTNRPGRVRYSRNYQDLPFEILKEMVEDKVEDQRIRDGIFDFLDRIGTISPDALSSLISECLIHNEVPNDFIDYFNISNDLSGAYEVIIETSGWQFKPGLAEEQKEQAQEYIESYMEYGIEYADGYCPDGKAHCDKVQETWRSTYCHPFAGEYRSPRGNSLQIRVNYADKAGSKKSRSFGYSENSIVSLTREQGEIIITTRDETVLRFRKTHYAAKAYSA